MSPTIHLHIGAHKTATTFVQNTLYEVLSRQAQPVANTLPLSELRAGFSHAFNAAFKEGGAPKVAASREELLRTLFAAASGTRPARKAAGAGGAPAPVLIVSDENLLGALAPIAKGGPLYPEAGARMQALKSVFDGHDLRFFMCVRDYGEYYPSAFAQTFKRMPGLSFRKFTEAVRSQQRGWLDVVNEVTAVIGQERLSIWTYEMFCKNPSVVFKALAPGLDISNEQIDSREPKNASIGNKALQCLQRVKKILNEEELKQLAKLLTVMKFSDDERLKFLDKDLQQQLAERYAADCRQLEQQGLAFLA